MTLGGGRWAGALEVESRLVANRFSLTCVFDSPPVGLLFIACVM